MSDSTDNFSSDLDPYRLLAQMYGGGLFGSSASPSWSDYVRAQYMPDPSLAAALASDVPGFHKSPAVLEALAATDPRPPGFYRSPALLGLGTPTPKDLPPAMDPQTVLFRWLGLSPSWLPSGPKVASAMTPAFYGQQTADNAVDPKRLKPGDLQPAAAGDLSCEGFRGGCESGGDYGTTATHIVDRRILCRKCALRKLGIEQSSPAEQIKTLRAFELR